jgi:hypothetical protein
VDTAAGRPAVARRAGRAEGQGLIWSERGHARDLAGFLLANGLLTPADLDEARQAAADNERSGVCEMARQRLQYRPRGS